MREGEVIQMKDDKSDVEIRIASLTDVARITEIYNQAIVHTVATFDTEPKEAHAMEPWFNRHGDSYPVFVASVDQDEYGSPVTDNQDALDYVVGWASLSRWSDRSAYDRTAEVSLYIDESFQSRGIGRMLFKQLLDAAPRVGLHTLISRIAGENEVSIHLHRKFGFDHIGTMREVGFKFGRLLDVHLYQLILPDSQTAGR